MRPPFVRKREKPVNNTNLKPFKPGESGNPSGRPKRQPLTDYLKEQLEKEIPQSMLDAMKEGLRTVFFEVYGPKPTFGQMIAFKLVQMSAKGDVIAMRELLDRVEGKVTQKTQLAGLDDGPVQTTITVKFVAANSGEPE
jgi:hypothetical protein